MYSYLGEEQCSSSMTILFWKRSLHMSSYLGSLQSWSSTILMSILAPKFSFVISGKQSSIVWTAKFISIILGIGLLIVITLSSSAVVLQSVRLHTGASIYWSFDIPNLHLICSKIGSKGRRNFGIRHRSPNFSQARDLYNESMFSTLDHRIRAASALGLYAGGNAFLKSHVEKLWAEFVSVLIVWPTGMIGRLQLEWDRSDVEELLLIVVPGTVISGSLNNTAVAGIVLGVINPELPSKTVLNTEITTAPCKPAVNTETSASTAAFYN